MRVSNMTARQARLRKTLSAEHETDAIQRILLRRRAAWDGRIAAERRQTQRRKDAAWIDIARALEIQGTDNPARLWDALASGQVQCRWHHPGRYWQHKPVPPRLWQVGAISGTRLIGPNGADLENEHQIFRINEQHWREYLGAPVTRASEPKASPRKATPQKITAALQWVYDEAEAACRKAPNIKEAPKLAQARLEAQGYYASQNEIGGYADQFESRRGPVGKTLKSQKVSK